MGGVKLASWVGVASSQLVRERGIELEVCTHCERHMDILKKIHMYIDRNKIIHLMMIYHTSQQSHSQTDSLLFFVNTTYVYYSVSLSLIKIILKFKLSF